MILFPNAKINLGLNITERRPDGYHNLESIFLPVGWRDILEIVPAKGDRTTLTVYGARFKCAEEDNLVMRAYRALNEATPLPPADIYLEKIIPDGAGLGGGSADAAFTLKGLNELFETGLNEDELAAIAAKIGADCPFFIYNRPMLATGTGTTLTPLEIELPHYYILIIKPDVSVSTKEAYAGVTPSPWGERLLELVRSGRLEGVTNDFERSIFAGHPELATIKQRLRESGAVYVSMSGSGSAIYGLYDDETMMAEATGKLGGLGMIYTGEL